MRVVTDVLAMQRLAKGWQAARRAVGFVPTMGFLHEGHMSLIREARRQVRSRGVVVVSIYVNPTQFAPTEDLTRYPRDLARDQQLCRAAGVDVLFVPPDREMYPADGTGGFSTYVVEESLSRPLEGRSRPTHFRGVTTVVAKLFNLVLPEVAVFGAKDCQQAAVVRRMVRDLNFPVRLVVAPTVRAPDGLALSSRNQYLSAEERQQATVLWRALEYARQRVASQPKPLAASALRDALGEFIGRQPAARLDYAEFFDPGTLEPVAEVGPSAHLALAVYIGKTRLIDNGPLGEAPSHWPRPRRAGRSSSRTAAAARPRAKLLAPYV